MKKYPGNFGELSYNETNKARFLAESKRVLMAVGRKLKESGACSFSKVSVNEAGIAVGGDVYGYFNDEAAKLGILVTITHSCMSGRPDGVVCYIQQRRPDSRAKPEDNHYRQIVGGNVYVPAHTIDVDTVLSAATRTLATHPDREMAASTSFSPS